MVRRASFTISFALFSLWPFSGLPTSSVTSSAELFGLACVWWIFFQSFFLFFVPRSQQSLCLGLSLISIRLTFRAIKTTSFSVTFVLLRRVATLDCKHVNCWSREWEWIRRARPGEGKGNSAPLAQSNQLWPVFPVSFVCEPSLHLMN